MCGQKYSLDEIASKTIRMIENLGEIESISKQIIILRNV